MLLLQQMVFEEWFPVGWLVVAANLKAFSPTNQIRSASIQVYGLIGTILYHALPEKRFTC